MLTPTDVTGLHHNLVTTEHHIDHALDTRNHRAFSIWCKKRASLSQRLQRLLLNLATNSPA